MTMSKQQAEIIAMDHQIAQLRLELHQIKSQYEAARGISNHLQGERAALAQKLYAEHGLILMADGVIKKREG